jgi:HlyD family secretion protein
MTRRRIWLSLVMLIVAASLAAGWALFLRPIQVQVLGVQRDIPVQVFGLGTVESRRNPGSESRVPRHPA